MNVVTDGAGNVAFTSAPLAGIVAGEIVSATATDLTTGDTSEFAANVTALAPGAISGTLYHDVDGDADVAEGGTLTFANATVALYLDDGDGFIDAGDTLVTTTTTDAAGLYSFTALASNTYYVVVDSKSLSADPNVWAEQTYGAAGAASGAGFTGAAGAVYGGRNATVSDNAAALTTAEHVTRVAVAGAPVANVDSGFSFNAVVNARGDAVDDDVANPRMQQGTLRQFILNANAIAGANAMRFVPAVATNDTDGLGNNWWQITLAAALPQITGADTTIDGTAYFAVVNGAARDDNAGFLGTGGTVGVSGLALGQVARPELEIVDGAAVAFGLDVNGANGVVRDLALSGFNTADIVVRNVANVTIEGNIIGTSASSFTDPGAAARSADEGIRVVSGDGGTIRGNLIGFHGDEGIQLNSGANNWLVEGNEIRGNGVTNAFGDGLNLTTVISGTTVRGNLIAGNAAAGVYVTPTSASNTVVNNTVTGNGIGGSEQFGIIFQGVGAGNVADRNVVTANTGVGIDIENGGTGAVTVIGNQVTANAGDGVRVAASNGHTIGGTGAGAGNVISGNAGNGVSFTGVTSGLVLGNTITGNFDPTPLPVPDTGAGVNIDNSSGVTVGGTAAGSRNVISGNQTQGVFIGFNSSNNWVAGNYLGTDATGTVAQANGHSGVLLYWNADNNTIGGTTAAARNLISGNGTGVWIEESSDNNVVSANYIGVDASGAADLGNGYAGVIVNLNSQGNRIGGTLAGGAQRHLRQRLDRGADPERGERHARAGQLHRHQRRGQRRDPERRRRGGDQQRRERDDRRGGGRGGEPHLRPYDPGGRCPVGRLDRRGDPGQPHRHRRDRHGRPSATATACPSAAGRGTARSAAPASAKATSSPSTPTTAWRSTWAAPACRCSATRSTRTARSGSISPTRAIRPRGSPPTTPATATAARTGCRTIRCSRPPT